MGSAILPWRPRNRPGALQSVFGLVLAGLLLGPGLAAAARAPKDTPPEPYALLAGTVLTTEGFSLPGVPVSVKRQGERKPKWRAVSDRRGEFAIRLPVGRATYEVATESRDHENETKTVEVAGDERVEVMFRLSAKKPARREQ